MYSIDTVFLVGFAAGLVTGLVTGLGVELLAWRRRRPPLPSPLSLPVVIGYHRGRVLLVQARTEPRDSPANRHRLYLRSVEPVLVPGEPHP